MKLRRFFWQTLVAFAILSITTSAVFFVLSNFIHSNIVTVLLSCFAALAFGVYLSFRLSGPVERLKERVEKVASGELHEVVDLSRNETIEIHESAKLMDAIASQLRHRIDVIQRQKDEQEAVLRSMEEGLLTVDAGRRVLHLNPAAAKIFRVHRENVEGRVLEEVIRVPLLHKITMEALEHGVGGEEDMEIAGDKTRYVRVHWSPLRDQNGFQYGVVLVLSDVTRMRELEGMRKNFVANVSHELRTPLTSIHGFAETLMNPAVTDPAEMKKFIEIIQRHATRLGRIIEDILTLSRIERDAESFQIEKKPEALQTILQAAVELCEMKANNKKMRLDVAVTGAPTILCDRYLLEQAVVNLIDNAIRYSDAGQIVEVTGRADQGGATIEVRDHGVGISEKQIPRIFERFYRVDKARSRELGGTGLGLSIVKHIIIAHEGRIEVESRLGAGSVFRIFLPLAVTPSAQSAST